jgi:hypothetical protein
MLTVKQQNECINSVLVELSEFLCQKNLSYDGSAFKEVKYGNKVVPAEDTIDVRITDKIRRLTGGGTNYINEPDEKDLLGYLVIKLALQKVREKEKAAAKEERKRQTEARVKEVVNDPATKVQRRRRLKAAVDTVGNGATPVEVLDATAPTEPVKNDDPPF